MGDGNDEVLNRDHTDLGDYDEVVTAEIQARLPVKSLMRFRCVCKSGRALISDSYFVKKHLSYGERGITESAHRLIWRLDHPFALDCEALESVKGDDVHGGCGGQFVTRLDFKINCHFGYRNLVAIGACNGLVCVSQSGTVNSNDIMLWNPCTRDSKVLPKPPRVHYLSFYGFGYDSANDDYKVIRGFSYWDGAHSKFTIHIFSLKRGSWRTVKDIDYVQVLTQQGLYFNGALHWLYWVRQGCSRILSFDLGAEKFQKTIPLPYDDWFRDPLIHKNCLCVFTCPTGTNSFNIWMMKEYGVKESWTEVVQFSLENCVLNKYINIDYREFFMPVCILENGIVLNKKIGCTEGIMVLYNLKKKKTFQHFDEVEKNVDFWTVTYRETIVSPNTNKTNNVSLLHP